MKTGRTLTELAQEIERAAFFVAWTYNRHGDRMFLREMEGNCPVWVCGPRRAAQLTEAEADAAIALIATYRGPLCPDGIAGVAKQPITPSRAAA